MISSNVKVSGTCFPKLMQSLSTGSIALVDSDKNAVILHQGSGQHAGTPGTSFTITGVESNWKYFDGEVTLSNKFG